VYVSNDYLISFITHLQENLCLKIQTQLKQIKISLNIHIKQIKSSRLYILLDRHHHDSFCNVYKKCTRYFSFWL